MRAAQQYWRADPKTIVVTVDESLGNVVDFFSDIVSAHTPQGRSIREANLLCYDVSDPGASCDLLRRNLSAHVRIQIKSI